MSSTLGAWSRVTTKNPCPICGKPDWCCIGQRYVNCMRLASDKPCHNGGWLHPINGAPVEPVIRPLEKPTVNCTALIREWSGPPPTCSLARNLGVDPISLEMLCCTWAPPHSAWAFPMRDPYMEITGIRLRSDSGKKWSVRGGHEGLFIPQCPPAETAWICEGPTDTAAALSIGCFAIGRPSCSGGSEMLRVLLRRLDVRRVIVVADNDFDKLRNDGAFCPGLDGANRLSGSLGIPSAIFTPPAKDMRDFIRLGATKSDAEMIVDSTRWRAP